MGCCVAKEIDHDKREDMAMQAMQEQRERELTSMLQQFPPIPASGYVIPPNPAFVIPPNPAYIGSPQPVYIPDYYAGGMGPPLRNV